jgi:hypothetical protein
MMSQEKEPPKNLTRKAFLVGPDVRLPMGEFTFLETAPIDRYAKAAFQSGRASLKKLMIPLYSISVAAEGETESVYPLSKFVPLVDASERGK